MNNLNDLVAKAFDAYDEYRRRAGTVDDKTLVFFYNHEQRRWELHFINPSDRPFCETAGLLTVRDEEPERCLELLIGVLKLAVS